LQIESVRALKQEIRETIVRPLMAQDTVRRSLGVSARRLNGPAWPRTFALGIVKPSGQTTQFRLALRVQHPMLLHSPHLQAIVDRAKGEVDVQYIGPIRKQQVPWYQDRCSPLKIGCSIGQVNVTAGSLGAFVRDPATGVVHILSNNHVLADENRGNPGDSILQPGVYDNGVDPTDRVATLARFIPLVFQGTNLVDCAIASIDNGNPFDSTTLDGFGQLAGLRTAPLTAQEVARKIGRTSGPTAGSVMAIELDNVSVDYDQGSAVFDSQIELQGAAGVPFSQGGDSGALIVDDANEAFALLFAGSSQGGPDNLGFTYANPLATVLTQLKVDLLS